VDLGGGLVAVALRSGAPAREVATVLGLLGPAVYLDFRPAERGGTSVSLVFQPLPDAVAGAVDGPGSAPAAPGVLLDAVIR
jgi:hypothetical protein